MIEKLIRALNEQGDDFGNLAFLPSADYVPVPISKSNFHEIRDIDKSGDVVFVDGGNAELIAAPNLSLQFLRTAAVLFRNNKRASVNVNEAYLLARASKSEKSISYGAELFKPGMNESFSFNPFDRRIIEGNHAARISKIGEIARRFLELETAKESAKKLEKGIVILDGSLALEYPDEEKHLEQLYNAASGKITLASLSKTSTLLTDKGLPFSAALARIAPEGRWYYHPVAENKSIQNELLFVKLNEKSKHIFKFEMNSKNFDEVLAALSENSKDLLFPGYPYGLILADKAARISKKEAERMKMIIAARAGSSFSRIREFMSSVNAHEILDSI